ncbi:MAG TPA: hypothetical protein VK559_07735 [Ferruginibacter sp.]|nr:hypothetical protein [Ferruginibacter sp.]
MQIIKSFIKLLVFISPLTAMAQSTYLPEGDKGYDVMDRLEIKYGNNTDSNFSSNKPYSRQSIVAETQFLDSIDLTYKNPSFPIGAGLSTADSTAAVKKYRSGKRMNLSNVDRYDMNSLLMNNTEWVTGSKASFQSKRSIFNTFYTTKPNLLEVNVKDFFLAVNPVIDFSAGKESGTGANDKTIFLNTRGISIRGMIDHKIGFYATMSDNQERGPGYFSRSVYRGGRNIVVPGVGFAKLFKNDTTAYDYFDARGYFTFNVAKYINVQFGYDKNFIGDGYRSLFLSDNSASYLFLKLDTKIWKIDYQNIFMELIPQFDKQGDTLLGRKYAAMHHLSMNFTKWLNVGLFEGIIFSRQDHFDFAYLNPIIFYRSIEGNVGSPDKAQIGLDFKANAAHHLQFYGQFLLDEFVLSQIKADTGWWGNKYAYQLGVKYIDAFGVRNLDLQFEDNRIRPFTYEHDNNVSNYTNYNQPLAHPLGANLQEFIGIVKYQPTPKWYITGKAIYYFQGLDSLDGRSYGGDPLRNYNDRKGDGGYWVGSGRKATCLNSSLMVSYEIRENLFFEGLAQARDYKIANEPENSSNTTMFTLGVRWNICKRMYDY